MSFVFNEDSGMTMEAEPTVYGVAYSMANDPARTQTSPGGEMFDGLYEWMDSINRK